MRKPIKVLSPFSSDTFNPLLLHLLNLTQDEERLHPKQTELIKQVTEHIGENPDHKVWIRLQRYSREVGRQIQRLLIRVGIDSALDPRLLPELSSSCLYPAEDKRVFISEKPLEGYAFYQLTLIIDYEWPIELQKIDFSFPKVLRRVLAFCRHARSESPVQIAPRVAASFDDVQFEMECESERDLGGSSENTENRHVWRDPAHDPAKSATETIVQVSQDSSVEIQGSPAEEAQEASCTEIQDCSMEKVRHSSAESYQESSIHIPEEQSGVLVFSNFMKGFMELKEQILSVGSFKICEFDYE